MNDFADRMAALRARFLDRLAQELPEIEALVPAEGAEQRAALKDKAHKLAGLGGSIGYPDLSSTARVLDELLGTPDPQPADVRAAATPLLAAMKAALNDR